MCYFSYHRYEIAIMLGKCTQLVLVNINLGYKYLKQVTI